MGSCSRVKNRLANSACNYMNRRVQPEVVRRGGEIVPNS